MSPPFLDRLNGRCAVCAPRTRGSGVSRRCIEPLLVCCRRRPIQSPEPMESGMTMRETASGAAGGLGCLLLLVIGIVQIGGCFALLEYWGWPWYASVPL